jgi:hypothetical protein
MFLVYFHPSNTQYRIAYVSEKKVTKYLNRAIEWSLSPECGSSKHKTTRKRKINDMDDSNPLKWMSGGNSARRNSLTALRTRKRHRRSIQRTKKRSIHQ